MVKRDGAWVSQGYKKKFVSTGTQNMKDVHNMSSWVIPFSYNTASSTGLIEA